MKRIVIRTERKIHKEVFYDIVYEWEDAFCKELDSKLFYAPDFRFGKHDINQSLIVRTGLNLENILLRRKTAFAFEMFGQYNRSQIHSSHSAICIIDFYPTKDLLHSFYTTYKKVPYLFISNREVYEFLIANNPERAIYHMPLSLPDKYRISKNTHYDKKYDLILVGRQNKQLMEWLKIFCKTHRLSYVYRKYINHEKKEFLYYTNNDTFVSNVVTRDDYFELLRKCKIAFYSTPGIKGDPKHKVSNGFSQVTPRYLELLSCGCHLMGTYTDNPDTRYYELDSFVNKVNSYQQFENIIKQLLHKEVDMEKYSNYLENHYTSVRARQFLEFLNR